MRPTHIILEPCINNYAVRNTTLLAETAGGFDPLYWRDTGISGHVTSSLIIISTIDCFVGGRLLVKDNRIGVGRGIKINYR